MEMVELFDSCPYLSTGIDDRYWYHCCWYHIPEICVISPSCMSHKVVGYKVMLINEDFPRRDLIIHQQLSSSAIVVKPFSNYLNFS